MSAEKNNRVDIWMMILDHLSQDEKLEIIARLSQSLHSKKKRKEKKAAMSLDDLYGAWQDGKSAEELIAEIRAARVEKTNFPEF